jgi:hypothetical protein
MKIVLYILIGILSILFVLSFISMAVLFGIFSSEIEEDEK